MYGSCTPFTLSQSHLPIHTVLFTPSTPHPPISHPPIHTLPFHNVPFTPSHSHPPMHTILFTPSHSHRPMHTLPFTPSHAHPPIHTLPFTLSHAHPPRNSSLTQRPMRTLPPSRLAFTRCSFTSSRLCTNQSSFHSSGPPALPPLLQSDCTTIGQYTTRPSISFVYAIHHPILAVAISCKDQTLTPSHIFPHRQRAALSGFANVVVVVCGGGGVSADILTEWKREVLG